MSTNSIWDSMTFSDLATAAKRLNVGSGTAECVFFRNRPKWSYSSWVPGTRAQVGSIVANG